MSLAPRSIALTVVLLAGCMPNQHGRLSATRTGTLIDPPATRVHANNDGLQAACGVATWREDPQPILRSPYLQQMRSDGATIVWTSSSADAQSVVIEAAGSNEPRTVKGVSQSTTFLTGAHQYAAAIDGLSASTTYCYSIVDATGIVRGPIGFRTAPNSDAPVDFLAFGDSGSGDPDQWALREQMETVPIDLIVHLGDLAYPSGTMQQYEDFVFNVYEELFESVPFFPSSGNHDYETADAGPFREVFMLPENGGAEGLERWYSFDWGPVHFVMLDTEVMSQTQANWLEHDLSTESQPWTIVVAHKPPYSSGSHGDDMTMRGLFGPIFDRYDVPLVLTGHDHHYERTEPIQGTTFIVSGGGGSSSRKPTASPHTAFAEDVMHFLSVHVDQDEILVHAIDGMGREFDSVRITRAQP